MRGEAGGVKEMTYTLISYFAVCWCVQPNRTGATSPETNDIDPKKRKASDSSDQGRDRDSDRGKGKGKGKAPQASERALA